MGKKEKKRKTSFLRRLYEKITSAPTEPEDPGVDVSDEEEVSETGANDQGNDGTSAVGKKTIWAKQDAYILKTYVHN